MAKALLARGYNTSIICSPGGTLANKCENSDVPYTTLKTSNFSFVNPLKLYQLKKQLKQIKTNIIFLNLPIDAKMNAIIKLKDSKLIYRRGMPNPIKKNKTNLYTYNKIDSIIANSEEIKRSICQNIPALKSKIEIVYNGVIVQERKAKKLNTQKTLRLGTLGRLVEQKGQEHLIRVCLLLKEKGIKFKLEIAGTGPLKQKLEDMIQKEKLESCISLVGQQDSSLFLDQQDIFVFPSHFEGSANAIIEAMQHALPTICYDISSMPEMIQDSVQGFLVPAFNEVLFANKIYELYQNPIQYQAMSENALLAVNSRFNYTQKCLQVEELMSRLYEQ